MATRWESAPMTGSSPQQSGVHSETQRTVPWLVVGFVAGLLFLLMLGRTGTVPVPDVQPPVFGLDKWLHFVDYLVLGLVVGWAVVDRRPRHRVGRTFLGTAGYGVSLELLQLAIPYRSFEFGDVGANLVGAAIGAGIWGLLLLVRSKR